MRKTNVLLSLLLFAGIATAATDDATLMTRYFMAHQMWLQSKNYEHGALVPKDLAEAYAWRRLYVETIPKDYPQRQALLDDIKKQLKPDQVKRADALFVHLRKQYHLAYEFDEPELERVQELRFAPHKPMQKPAELPSFQNLLGQLRTHHRHWLASALAKRYWQAHRLLQQSKSGRIIYGRVLVDGPEPAQTVAAPMQILPGGYFVMYIPQHSHAIDFRLSGYQPVQKVLDNYERTQNLGNIILQTVPITKTASITGSIWPLNSAAYVVLQIQPTDDKTLPVQTRHSWRWPATDVSVTPEGKFSANNLSPTRYQLIIISKDGRRQEKSVSLKEGEIHDLGEISFAKVDSKNKSRDWSEILREVFTKS